LTAEQAHVDGRPQSLMLAIPHLAIALLQRDGVSYESLTQN